MKKRQNLEEEKTKRFNGPCYLLNKTIIPNILGSC